MLTTLSQYLSFRAKQFFRILKDIGLGHLIILAPILFIGILGLLQFIFTSEYFTLAAFLLFSLGGNHWNRKDRFFLEQLSLPISIIFCLDYTILSSPFIACFIFWAKWQNLIALIIGICILALVKPPYHKGINKKMLHFFPLDWIPVELFEWRTGLRQNAWIFILVYSLGLGLSFYPVTALIVIFLMAYGVTTFFQFFENKDLLLAINHDKKILQKKTLGSLKLFNLLMLPHYLLFIFFNPTPIHLAVLAIITVIAQLIIIFSIAMKYKTYSFHEHKIYNSLPLAIFIACWAIPFLWPIPILMVIRFWKKAKENLIYHYA
jgi:hypothetical protein